MTILVALHKRRGTRAWTTRSVKAGEGRIAQCLKEHQSELSRGCAAKIP